MAQAAEDSFTIDSPSMEALCELRPCLCGSGQQVLQGGPGSSLFEWFQPLPMSRLQSAVPCKPRILA